MPIPALTASDNAASARGKMNQAASGADIQAEADARAQALAGKADKSTTDSHATRLTQLENGRATNTALAAETAARQTLAEAVGGKADGADLATEQTARALGDRPVPSLVASDGRFPGLSPQLFTATLSGVSGVALPITSPVVEAVAGIGSVLVLAGEGTVAPIRREMLKPGVARLLTWDVRRKTVSSDPVGDSVELRCAFLNEAGNIVSNVWVAFSQILGVGERLTRSAVIGSGEGEGIDRVWPATAVYAVPYVRTYNAATQTQIIEISDRPLAEVPSDERIAALTAQVAEAQAAVVQTQAIVDALGITLQQAVEAAAAGTIRAATLTALPNGTRVGQPGEVTGPGSDRGAYAWSGSAWVRVGDLIDPAAVTALQQRVTPLFQAFGAVAGSQQYSVVRLKDGGMVVLDDQRRQVMRLRPTLYDFLLPVRARSFETALQMFGGTPVRYLPAARYARSGRHGRVMIDEDHRILGIQEGEDSGASMPRAGGTFTGPVVLASDAAADLNPVPLRQMNAAFAARSSPVRRGVWWVALHGDSRTDNSFAGSDPNRYITQSRAYPFWLEVASKGAVRANIAWDFGKAGENSAQIRDRAYAAFQTAAAGGANAVIIMAGTNDPLGMDSAANIQQMIDWAKYFGLLAVVIAETPRGMTASWSTTPERFKQHLKLHQQLLRMRNQVGVRVVNVWPELVDPTSIIGAPKAGYFYDNLHLNCVTGMILGNAVWEQAFKQLASTPPLLTTNAADLYDATYNPLGNLVANGMMIGTGGTKGGTGTVTGDVADGWTVAPTSQYSVAASKVARADGSAAQQLAISGTPTNGSQSVTFSRALDLSQIAAGDIVELAGSIEVDAGSQNAYGPELGLVLTIGGSTDARLLVTGCNSPVADATSPSPSVSYGGPFFSQRFPWPAGVTAASVRTAVFGAVDLPLAITMRASNLSLRKCAPTGP